MVKIRLRRVGRKKAPVYRIVVADSQEPARRQVHRDHRPVSAPHGRPGRSTSTPSASTTGSTSARSRRTPSARCSARRASSSSVTRRASPSKLQAQRRSGRRASRTQAADGTRAPMTTPDPAFIIVGRVRKAHGIRGEVVVEPITDAPDAIFASGRRVFAGTATGDLAPDRAGAARRHRVRPFNDGLLVAFDEVADRNAAELWRGRYLLAARRRAARRPAKTRSTCTTCSACASSSTDGEHVGTVEETYELPQGLALDVRRAAPRERRPCCSRIDERTDRARSTREARVIVVDAARGTARVRINVVTIFPEFFAAPLGAQHSGARRGGGAASTYQHRRPARLHARPAPHGRRLSVRRRGRDGDEAGALLRGGRSARRRRRRSCS